MRLQANITLNIDENIHSKILRNNWKYSTLKKQNIFYYCKDGMISTI